MNPQYRMLCLLRDEGPLSRAELGDRLELPRPRVHRRAGPAGRGRDGSREAGPAASRGGRRSTLVELHPDIRFAGVDLGATSIDVEITDGRLEPVAAYAASRPTSAPGRRRCCTGSTRSWPSSGRGRVRPAARRSASACPGPVSFRDGVPVSPPIMPGWDRYPVRELLGPRAQLPGRGRQRREHHGGRRALRRRGPVGRQPALREDRYRHRLRHLPRRRGLPGYRTGAPATSATSRSTRTGRSAPAATSGCLEALFGGAALARDATRRGPGGRLAGAGRTLGRQRHR